MKRTKLFMDTVVDIQVADGNRKSIEDAEKQIDRAFEAFRTIEQACSRFSADSELMGACRKVGTPVPISPYLYEPLKFALQLAEWTNGIFDPTVGKVMEEQGFNRHYLTKQSMNSPSAESVTYRDIELDERDRMLLLRKPLVIDLGAVAKGFAIDLAANELKEFEGFVVNAGGDLFAGGVDEWGNPWDIGIRHPERKQDVIRRVKLSNEAICTSGSYERRSVKRPDMHHIINPRTGEAANDWISCSVIAPFAMMADAFSTAAFVLGSESGAKLLEEAELKGILITPELQIVNVGGI